MPRIDPQYVGVDVGSSKVCVLIGQVNGGEIEVVGKGLAPNRGTRRGNIVNVDATIEALRQATEEAEVMAGVEVSRAYVGTAGADIRSVNSRGMVSVARKDREVSRQDIDRVLEAAQAAALPSDREILHAIPQEFAIDNQNGVIDPIGMLGSRLEVAVHLVTGHRARLHTLLNCVNRAGIEVAEVVFEPLATAMTVLTPDERELGALLVDIGAGTTGYAYFCAGEAQHSAVLPIASGHLTNDLAMVLRTPFAEAEEIKIRRGCCLQSLVEVNENIPVAAVGGGTSRLVPRSEVVEILQPRAQEILQLVHDDVHRMVAEVSLRGGVVLTGGGAQLDGLAETAEEIFDASVRPGLPTHLKGLVDVIRSPIWSTSAGLLLYAHAAEDAQDKARSRQWGGVRAVMGNLREILSDLL